MKRDYNSDMICPFCEKTIGDNYVVCPVCNKRLPLKPPSVNVKKSDNNGGEEVQAEELDLSKAFVDGKPLQSSGFGGLDDLFKIFSGGSFFGGLFDDDIFEGSIFGGSPFGNSLFEDISFSDDDEDDEEPRVLDLEQSADGTFKESKKKRQ